MATFGLWYLKWNGRAYISRLSDNGHEASVYDFKRRAFSYAVALGNSWWDINYTGAVNGFNDGFELMNFVTFKLNGVGYYITSHITGMTLLMKHWKPEITHGEMENTGWIGLKVY